MIFSLSMIQPGHRVVSRDGLSTDICTTMMENHTLSSMPEHGPFNVSAELLDSIPVSIAELCGFLRRIQPGEKIGSLKEARAQYSSD